MVWQQRYKQQIVLTCFSTVATLDVLFGELKVASSEVIVFSLSTHFPKYWKLVGSKVIYKITVLFRSFEIFIKRLPCVNSKYQISDSLSILGPVMVMQLQH